jgi:rubredoxin
MTYSYYRRVKKKHAVSNAPAYIDKSRVYRCSACGFIYDESREGIRFSDLPENWKCPFCCTEKEYFNEV